MNEFVKDAAINLYINTVYQSMYTKTDRGIKNGEVDLVINTQPQAQYNKQYFDGGILKPKIK